MLVISDIQVHKASTELRKNIEISRYKTDLAHFMRIKPTRKMRIVKGFLDVHLRNRDQDVNRLDKDLSLLYSRFHDQQNIR